MSERAADIVIAGGGMVGVSLALCLAQKLPAEYSILLVESFELPGPDASFAENYSSSFDARSTALAYGSCLIYRELGLWETLEPHCCAIASVHVSERGRFGSTLMQAADYGWPALGYVLENAWLGNGLVQALHRSRVRTLSPARVVSARLADAGMQLALDNGDRLDAALLVVADGADSGLRDTLGVEAAEQDYGQRAVIANIAHGKPHGGRAFERFTPDGPLALLPLLPDPRLGPRSALVWSLPEQSAERALALDDAEFLQALQDQFGYRLGRLRQPGARHSYPLRLVQAREQVRSGVVVMGNAAHSLHPVAGQGFNLALRDIARLGSVLQQAVAKGRTPGELEVLQRYAELQAGDQRRTTLFSDQLPGLFSREDPALALLRDVGLFALDLSPALKREFVRQTSGVASSSEYRDVRP